MSKQQADQIKGEPASLAASIDAPKLVPEQGASAELEAPGADAPTPAPNANASKPDAAKADVPSADAVKADAPPIPGKVMIMSAADHSRHGAGPETESPRDQAMFGQRRSAALAAIVALAAVTGALGGALATASLGHFAGDETASADKRALASAIARIDSDILDLKVSVEHTAKMSMSQLNKTSDRLDKAAKPQPEPAAKPAAITEALDKLRAAPPAQVAVAAAPAAPIQVAAAPLAKEVTGSITAPAAAVPAKVEVARLPTVEGWVLRDIGHGAALIEGRRGMYEVYAGDGVPGLGRIDAIRRQDGRWVVVTGKGLIVAR